MKGWTVILYILSFLTFVAVVYTIERRDSQTSAKNQKELSLLKAELEKLQKEMSVINADKALATDRLTSIEQGLGTMAEKTTEYFRITESKLKDTELLAHSAKMDALRRPQKIEIDMPAIKLIQSCAKKKVKQAAPASPDQKVIKNIKSKLKELSQ
jgi:hypothetical protein